MSHPTPKMRARLLTSAATGLALLFAQGAIAQETDVEEVPAETEANEPDDVVRVTGFRASIENSIEAKRSSSSIVEAVSAEDIGKLPDLSIAEALARLPGLTAQRLRGRAQQISVRGLGPDFTTALLNGREQVTAGDNRGVEFDQYPSELLSQVVVYKTPDAALLGQGLAGTADLRTIRPLEYGERAMQFGARYEWNDYDALNSGTEDDGYRITGSYIDQFANDTIGLAIGFADQSSPTQAERWEAWGYPETDGAFIIGGAKPYVQSQDLERTAVIGTLEFEPTAGFRASVDGFYSEFSDVGLLRGVELPLFWSGAQLQPGFTVQDGIVTDGVFNGVQGVVRNDTRFRDAELTSFGLNAQWDVGERWMLEYDLSFSGVKRDDVDLETYAGTGAGFGNGASDNLAFSLQPDGNFIFDGQLNYADPSVFVLTDPQGWGQVGFIKRPSTEDELTALRFSADREFDDGAISNMEIGFNYTQREKTKRSDEDFIDLANGATETPIPSDLLLEPTSLAFLGLGDMVSWDPQAMLASGVYTLRPNTNPDVVTKSWDVDEDVLTLYAKFDLDTTLFNLPLIGNFGAQYVTTDQSSIGTRVGSDANGNPVLVQVEEGAEFDNFLPSANLQFQLAENTFFRLGAARTLARARMDDLRASQELGTDTSVLLFPSELTDGDPSNDVTGIDIDSGRAFLSLSGGNPQLEPYLADSFDVSFEHYFGGAGYISAAVFYKDLQDFVFNGSTSTTEVTGLVDAFEFNDGGTIITGDQLLALNPGIETAIVTQPANGDGGYLQGLELAASIPGDLFLPEPLDGFGVQASISFTESEITPQGEPDPIPIPGLSETVSNVTVYYEKGGFSSRLSRRYRSDFLGEVTGFGAGREFRTVQEEAVFDAQLSYAFQNGGSLDGLTLLLQGNNLTDEEFVTVADQGTGLVRDFQQYGATYLVGFSYKR